MTQDTAEKMSAHHDVCGGHDFSRSIVQRGEKEVQYTAYQCLKCKEEFLEVLTVVEPVTLQEKAA
jgi:hypothetical protein